MIVSGAITVHLIAGTMFLQIPRASRQPTRNHHLPGRWLWVPSENIHRRLIEDNARSTSTYMGTKYNVTGAIYLTRQGNKQHNNEDNRTF